jgi:hypothetical protein
MFKYFQVSTQSTRKADLSNTLSRLKNVLHKLPTKQYVIIDTKKVIKSQNTASKDIYSNVIGCQQSKIFNKTTEETNFMVKI